MRRLICRQQGDVYIFEYIHRYDICMDWLTTFCNLGLEVHTIKGMQIKKY